MWSMHSSDLSGCGRPWHSISHCSNKIRCWSAKYSVTPNVLTIIISLDASLLYCHGANLVISKCGRYIRGKGVVTRLQQIVQWGLINVPSNRRCRSRLSSMYVWAPARINNTSGNDLSATAWLRLDLRADSVDWLIKLTQNVLFKGHERSTYVSDIFTFIYRYQSDEKEGIPSGVWLLAKKA